MGEGNLRVIDVKNLVFEYRNGGKKFRAVNDVTFNVNPGETVGFIGANGAGKTTTIKTLMGFQFPTSGVVEVFGEKAGTPASRRRIGYLPEVSLYYSFMKACELMELYGGLHEVPSKVLRTKIPEVLERVGLGGREKDLLGTFSKGMQQRLGIAQAIIADPEALILDELYSGLDPVGRHDLRKVLVELQSRGKTIFFSSHELAEVENLCDRVVVIDHGEIIASNTIREMQQPLDSYEITFLKPADWKEDVLPESVGQPTSVGDAFRVEVEGSELCGEVLHRLSRSGAEIVTTHTRHRNLEDYFMDLVRGRRAELGERL